MAGSFPHPFLGRCRARHSQGVPARAGGDASCSRYRSSRSRSRGCAGRAPHAFDRLPRVSSWNFLLQDPGLPPNTLKNEPDVSGAAFLICSDERQEAATFAPFPVTVGQGTLLGDLFSLAGCDYVVGPPSTYSLWAAFYGRKPLYHMIEPEPPRDLSSFMVPEGRFDCIDLKLHDREIERRRLSRVHHTGVQ